MKTKRLFTSLTLGLWLTMALLWLLTGLPQVARADTPHYVTSDCTGVPAPCHTTIQEAVDTAAPDDEILVASGVYTGVQNVPNLNTATFTATQVVVITKTVAIRGGYTTTNWNKPDPIANPTTLDAQGQGRVLYITGNISPTFEGLRITGGDAAGLGGSPLGDSGGGMYVITATLTKSNNQVFSNTALVGGGLYFQNSNGTLLIDNMIGGNNTPRGGSGGGVYFNKSANVTLTGNTISNNEAGPWLRSFTTGGGVVFENSPGAMLSDNIISGNRATNEGGLKFSNSPTATLIANTISNNVADHTGGGMKHHGGVLFVNSDNATLISNTISGNYAANTCGGVCFSGSDNPMLIGNNIVGNRAGTPGYTVSPGGGLNLYSTNANLVGNTISNNSTNTYGGGLYIGSSTITLTANTISANEAAQGGGLYLFLSNATLSDNAVIANTVHDYFASYDHYNHPGNGGGLFLNASTITLTNTFIADNQAETAGGGLFLTSYTNRAVTLINTVVADNQAEAAGSGLYIQGYRPRLLHTTIARNSGGDGSGVYITGTTSTVALTNTILVSHTVGITVTAGNTVTLNGVLWYNNTNTGGEGYITITNEYTGAPVFAADGYHLTLSSEAIDKGVNADVTMDIDGDQRPCGLAPDLGADEFVHPIYLPVILKSSG